MTIITGLNLEEEVVKESTLLQDAQERFEREQLILELKERGFSKEEIIKKGFTPEEYQKYIGKSLRKIGQEYYIKAASIMNQAVG